MSEESKWILGEDREEIVLSRFAAVAELSQAMVEQARYTVRVLTRDLNPLIYSSESLAAALAGLCRNNPRRAVIQILLAEPERVIGQEHRLLQLAQRLSSFVHIRQPAEQHRSFRHAFMTVDTTGFIYQEQYDRPEAKASFNFPFQARDYDQSFAEMWGQSEVISALRRLSI